MEPLYNELLEIIGHFLLQYRGFPLLEVKSVLVTSVGTTIFVLIMEVFLLYPNNDTIVFYCIQNLDDLLRELPLQ